MPYELVELSTGNTVGYYDTEQAALRDVVEAIERYGQQSVETLVLGYDDPGGEGHAIAKGKALAKLAHEQFKLAVGGEAAGRDLRDIHRGPTSHRGSQTPTNGDLKDRKATTGRYADSSTVSRHTTSGTGHKTKKT